MPNTLTVLDSDRRQIFQSAYSEQDFRYIRTFIDNGSVERTPFLWSLLYPMRTDNVPCLLQDLLIPHLSIPIIGRGDGKPLTLALEIITSLGVVVSVILSLPIRLVTVLPRCIYNACYSQSNPFYDYLVGRGVSPESLRAGFVYLRTEEENLSVEGDLRYTTQTSTTREYNFIARSPLSPMREGRSVLTTTHDTVRG